MSIKRIKSDSIWYFGFMLTSALSLVLSVLLFTSVADSRLSWVLLMGIALALELGKIITINDHRQIIAGLLIGVSVLGSAGGLNRAITVADDTLNDALQQRETLLAQIDQTRRTMEQNNQAIERYIDLDRIRGEARPLQDENRTLQQHLSEQQAQLQALSRSEVPELTAALTLLATVLAMPLAWVKSVVILLLAGLLDALTVNFIRSGVLEYDALPLQTPPQDKAPLPTPELQIEADRPEPQAQTVTPANVTALDDSYPAFKRMMLERKNAGEGVLSQRACIRQMNLRERLVRQYYNQLMDEGIIGKNRRGQFEFVTQPEQRVMRLV